MAQLIALGVRIEIVQDLIDADLGEDAAPHFALIRQLRLRKEALGDADALQRRVEQLRLGRVTPADNC